MPEASPSPSYVKVERAGDRMKVLGAPHRRIERVVGHAVNWTWNGERLTVNSNRFGFQPLFYYADRDTIIVSESLEAVVRTGASRRYDYVALSVFLRLGYFVGNDTPFSSVRAVPPNSQLVWKDGAVSIRSLGAVTNQSLDISRSKAIDAFIESFREVMQNLLEPDEQSVVPLSGGRDSRHILLEMVHLGHKPAMTLTLRDVPPRYIDETVVARRLAAAAGVRHRIIDPSPGVFRRELRRNRLTHFCADEHSWLLPVADEIEGKFDSIYDGLSGGVVTSGTHLSKERLQNFRCRRYGILADEMLGTDDRVRFVLPKHLRRRMTRTMARDRISEEIARYADRRNPVATFIFMNRIRREVSLAAFAIMSEAAQVKAPFVTPSLVDLMFSLPPEHFLDHSFHSEAIDRAYPHFANLAYQADSGIEGQLVHSRFAAVRMLKRRAVALRHARAFTREILRYAQHSPNALIETQRTLPVGFAYDYLVMAGHAGIGTMSLYLNQLERLRVAPEIPLPSESVRPLTARSLAASEML